jgi:hypothetical protein
MYKADYHDFAAFMAQAGKFARGPHLTKLRDDIKQSLTFVRDFAQAFEAEYRAMPRDNLASLHVPVEQVRRITACHYLMQDLAVSGLPLHPLREAAWSRMLAHTAKSEKIVMELRNELAKVAVCVNAPVTPKTGTPDLRIVSSAVIDQMSNKGGAPAIYRVR